MKTNATANKKIECAEIMAQLEMELVRSMGKNNKLTELLSERNGQQRERDDQLRVVMKENASLKKQHAAIVEELGRSTSAVNTLEGQLRELKNQLRELKTSTALHEHKHETANIATSTNDDECRTFEKHASLLAENSTTDSCYSDSKDDDISIRSDCSDHCESINFSEEKEKNNVDERGGGYGGGGGGHQRLWLWWLRNCRGRKG